MTTQSNNTIRIATIPGLDEEPNPYLQLLYKGLREHGIDVVAAGHLYRNWLRTNRDKVDLIHFHWSWGHFHPQFLSFANLLPRFVAKLLLAKRYGYKIVWTVHDFFPPQRHHIALQYLENLSLAQLSDGIFVNFHQAVKDVQRWFFRKRGVYLIPHGNYSLWYPNTVKKEEARDVLDLPANAFVYLLFGAMRPNRGIESAVRAFQQITSPDSQEMYMVIAGRTWPGYEALELSLRRQIGSYGNIRRITEYVPDDRVQYYFNAADVVVLPYRYIYTSGAAFLALSFAKPVIAPRMGNLPELVHNERIGILFEPGDLSSLVMAMKAIRERTNCEALDYLRQECRRYDWDAIWPLAAEAFRKITKR